MACEFRFEINDMCKHGRDSGHLLWQIIIDDNRKHVMERASDLITADGLHCFRSKAGQECIRNFFIKKRASSGRNKVSYLPVFIFGKVVHADIDINGITKVNQACQKRGICSFLMKRTISVSLFVMVENDVGTALIKRHGLYITFTDFTVVAQLKQLWGFIQVNSVTKFGKPIFGQGIIVKNCTGSEIQK